VQLFKMLGILPVMVHPEPDNALMIAFGAGMSAGACVDEVEGLDCVDLNPDITGVAAVFTHENRDVINNPGLNMIVNDGRNALLLDPKQYSLIISDATNPKTFDSWTLYTQEFYELVKARLKPGGVFCQWVVIPLPYDSMRMLLSTFKSVFPHTSFWCIYGSSQCMMLGTPERLEIDYPGFSDRLEPVLERMGLPEYGVGNIDKFLSFMLLGEDELDQALKGFTQINTDDLPAAQFRMHGEVEGVRDFLHLLRFQTLILPYLTNLGAEEERVKAVLETYRSLARRLTLGFLLNNTGEYWEAEEEAAAAGMAGDENVKSALKYDSERKRYFSSRVAESGGDANDHNSLGIIYWREGDYARAIENLERAVGLNPGFAHALANLARVYTDAGLYDEATETWMKVRKINPTRNILSTSTRQLDIIHLLRKLCYQPDSSALHASLGELFLADGETVRAARATRKAAELSQGDPQIYLRLARLYENLEYVDQALETYEELAVLVPEDERFQRAVDNLELLRTDPAAKQRWLNSNEIVIEGEEPADEHPSTCREASQVWNDAPFEGKIGSESLELAAALYEKSIRAKPDDLHAYADAARIYELLGEYGRAASLWRRGLEVVPGNRAAENNVRRLELLAETGGPEELVEIGQLFQFNGETDTAVEFFSRAADADPAGFDSWAHLAAGYDQVGRYHEAALAYERALELQPDGAGARVIQERLGRIESMLGNCKIHIWEESADSIVSEPTMGPRQEPVTPG
jgi:tetratricopeptide (TPR) repeat protein